MTKAPAWDFVSADGLSLADGFGLARCASLVGEGEIGLSLGSASCALMDLFARLQNNPLTRRKQKILLDPCRFMRGPLIWDLHTVHQQHGPPSLFYRAGRVARHWMSR